MPTSKDLLMRAASPGARGCAMSFGPGLIAETMLFQTVGDALPDWSSDVAIEQAADRSAVSLDAT
jgi:hypothetical protein